MTASREEDVLSGAQRVHLFEESDGDPAEVGPVEQAIREADHLPGQEVGEPPRQQAQAPPPRPPGPPVEEPDAVALARAELIRPGETARVLATWGTRGAIVRGSGRLVRLKPGPAEQAHLGAERTIRQATWSRSVNVLVANKTGGVGKTVTSVVLTGVLAAVRGGSVAAYEVSDATGALEKRGEGAPSRGLGELVRAATGVSSSGELAGFTAPQTSHADVIGSVRDRPVLTAEDVRSVRAVLDRYYRITIADSGNNPHSEAFGAAVSTADVLVIPTLVSSVSVLDALDLLGIVAASSTHGRYLAQSAVVLINHDGRPEDAETARRARRQLAMATEREYPDLGLVEVPFDGHVARGGEITLTSMSADSRRAWTHLGATVVGQLLQNVR